MAETQSQESQAAGSGENQPVEGQPRAASEQKTAVAHEILGVAHALRRTHLQLEQEGHASAAGYARQAAETAERIGRSIEHKRLSDLVDDFEAVGRSQPVLLFAASALFGFAATRWMRGSNDVRSSNEEGGM